MQSLANKVGAETSAIDQQLDYYFSCEDGSRASTCDIMEKVRCQEMSLHVGSGCDGRDNNCDDEPDDCSEDVTPPSFDFSEVIPRCATDRHIFSSATAGLRCVDDLVKVTDDCSPQVNRVLSTVDVTADPSNHLSSCGETYSVNVVATEERCPENTKSESFLISVYTGLLHNQDVCELPQGADTLPQLSVADAVNQCSGDRFWMSTQDAIECVKSFSIVSDPCRKVLLKVDVEESYAAWEGCASTEHHEISVSTILQCNFVTQILVGCSTLTHEVPYLGRGRD